MFEARQKSHRHAPWRVFLGLLCVALAVLGGTIQMAHSHPGGDISHADCSLCLTAHVVAQVAGNPVAVPAALVVASVEELLPEGRPASLSVFALFTRPPPALSRYA